MEWSSGFNSLPENCISEILSITTPRDACRLSLISHEFRSVGNSDLLWERFLPPDYEKIISESLSPLVYISKKALYFSLCHGILTADGRRWFSLERATGKICYAWSARNLYIPWSDASQYWRWTSRPDSRFPDVAVLREVCWLEIKGTINCQLLSTKTTYVAYLLIQFGENASNLDAQPSDLLVHTKNEISRVNGYLRPGGHESQQVDSNDRVAHIRDDGWFEMEIGEFYVEAKDDGDVVVQLIEGNGHYWKRGLIVEGIEVQPRV